MATVSLYLDVRAIKADGTAPVKIIIRNRGGAAHLPTGIDVPPVCWQDGKVVNTRSVKVDKPAVINAKLTERLAKVTLAVNEICGPKANMSASLIKAKVNAKLYGISEEEKADTITLGEVYDAYLATKKQSSVASLLCGKAFLEKYMPKTLSRPFCELGEDWAEQVYLALEKSDLKPNTKLNYLTYIKTMWNWGRKKKFTSEVKIFEEFQFSPVATPSRALTLDEIRTIWFYDPEQDDALESWKRKKVMARDVFVLTFCLCGINMADLHELKESDIHAGRLETDRKKTGVHINIKLEPEALEIINKYKKDGYLIGKIRKKYNTYLSNKIAKYLRLIDNRYDLSIYWARHSWVSFGVELDIPDRTVFMGIAHSPGKRSDETYVTSRHKKLDDANRKIIDYVKGDFIP